MLNGTLSYVMNKCLYFWVQILFSWALTHRNMIIKIGLQDLLMEWFVEPGSTLNFFGYLYIHVGRQDQRREVRLKCFSWKVGKYYNFSSCGIGERTWVGSDEAELREGAWLREISLPAFMSNSDL